MTASSSVAPTATGLIHPTAIIDPAARLGKNISVGAYAVIGAGVELGDGCEVMHHANLAGPLKAGPNNRFFPFCSIGMEPQDKKFHGETSRLEIGEGNAFREFVTVNRGTEDGGGLTRIGDRNWIMAYCHIAHDCLVGNDIVFSNNATLGGHVVVEDKAILGGFTAVHQFCRIGTLVMTGGYTMIAQDVAPYVKAVGNRAQLFGVNSVGLERNGFTKEEIRDVQRAYKMFFRGKTGKDDALGQLKEAFGEEGPVGHFIRFIQDSERGITR